MSGVRGPLHLSISSSEHADFPVCQIPIELIFWLSNLSRQAEHRVTVIGATGKNRPSVRDEDVKLDMDVRDCI